MTPKEKTAKKLERQSQRALRTLRDASPQRVNPKSILSQRGRLPQRTLGELLTMWENAVRKLADDKQKSFHSAATSMIREIEFEWRRRSAGDNWKAEYFKWPTTDAPGGSGNVSLFDAPNQGLLAYLGYRAGRTNGIGSSARQIILARVFDGSLPPLNSPSYMREWGIESSPARLKKIAEAIASFSRNAKRRHDARLAEAIRDWENDLRFLWENYYVGKFGFDWPTT